MKKDSVSSDPERTGYFHSRKTCEGRLQIFLGGRAALEGEIILLDELNLSGLSQRITVFLASNIRLKPSERDKE